ncbi:hypothetical protein [Piscinibacterium candidicorallinum]|uniref:Phosphatidate cytidylyltransferase n=1 Tax=Piscinibacterium candidicorallinum TaxID=1793872 RepID=A0ABV7H2B7_9BURK
MKPLRLAHTALGCAGIVAVAGIAVAGLSLPHRLDAALAVFGIAAFVVLAFDTAQIVRHGTRTTQAQAYSGAGGDLLGFARWALATVLAVLLGTPLARLVG